MLLRSVIGAPRRDAGSFSDIAAAAAEATRAPRASKDSSERSSERSRVVSTSLGAARECPSPLPHRLPEEALQSVTMTAPFECVNANAACTTNLGLDLSGKS